METTLHRQLKDLYAAPDGQLEATLGRYRIDVINGDSLVEIQHGPLAAIRDKTADLLRQRRNVLIVKPILISKRLVKLNRKGGAVQSRRMSPKRGDALDLFDELVYFTRVFPHQRLRLEAPLIDVEEWRYPGHGRRRRRRDSDFCVEDRKLLQVHDTIRLQTAEDLRSLTPAKLPRRFHTGHLAEGLRVKRWIAQRIAYCFRQIGTTRQVGKQGNTLLYEFVES